MKKSEMLTNILITACIVFGIMLIASFDFVYEGFFRYLFSQSYRNMFPKEEYANALDFLFKSIRNSNINFDMLIIFGSSIMVFFIPIIPMIGTIVFNKYWKTIYQQELYRSSSDLKFIFGKIIKHSFITSIGCLIGFLLFFAFTVYYAKGQFMESMRRSIFADWFGNDFYSKHRYIHHILEGTLRFYFIPFIYSIMAMSVSILNIYFALPPLIPLLYYYGGTVLTTSLYGKSRFLFIHANPMGIMSSGDFHYINTLAMILINAVPLFIGIGIILWRTKIYEG